ncbi:uncharacterized protein K02A2.6 [Nephila pilipes]|uniref:Uncharacterized protein K02A2.6 n=1 Tax=Nephila pilipes TaxID=299642 RepID=A0A8X6QQ01_NEPPI|nr:uncharacterized protein K02A2.6 [Nephila pilipes]
MKCKKPYSFLSENCSMFLPGRHLAHRVAAQRKLKHVVQHSILTRRPPVFSKPRRLPPDKLKAAKQEFQYLVEIGICRPSRSCWASSLHMVSKMSHIQDCLQVLEKKRLFSTPDLAKSYHQIPVQEEDILKTAVTTSFELFDFLHMPFGLSNAAAPFQRFIHYVLKGMDFCVPYFDDVLVASEEEGQHFLHLKQMFQRFEEYGMVLNASKNVLSKTSVKFLGHIVTAEGIFPIQEKVVTITNFPKSETMKELRRFRAICNFYRRSIYTARC